MTGCTKKEASGKPIEKQTKKNPKAGNALARATGSSESQLIQPRGSAQLGSAQLHHGFCLLKAKLIRVNNPKLPFRVPLEASLCSLYLPQPLSNHVQNGLFERFVTHKTKLRGCCES